MRNSDILCITETWSQEPNLESHTSFTVKAPRTSTRHRLGGGVSVVFPNDQPIKICNHLSDTHFQMISLIVFHTPVVAAYVSPQCPTDTFNRFLSLTNHILRGPGILIGDLNSRHNSWDTSTNRNGSSLNRWALRHNFLTNFSPKPTFQSQRGSSRVDVVFFRGTTQPTLTVHPITSFSDHAPLTANINLSTVIECPNISLSLIGNSACRRRAKLSYYQNIPQIVRSLKQCSSPASLEINSRRLASATISPWAAMESPRSRRFRPGWTRRLDEKAKNRTRLFRSGNPDQIKLAKKLDKEIKREFRRNKRALTSTIADEIANQNPSRDSVLLKRLLQIDNNHSVTSHSIDPDEFTDFMSTLQPSSSLTQTVPIMCFTLDLSFKANLLSAILSAKPKKSPGPDKNRTELFKIAPNLFADALFSLWESVGRLGHMPSLLSSGFFSPIYKGKGDRQDPSNYRPIALTTSFRRIITTAISMLIKRSSLSFHENQRGFLTGSNTEISIAYAVNKSQNGFSKVLLLDLRKAFDIVPRIILQELVDEVLPPSLSIQIRPLLYPMRFKTKNQRSSTFVRTLAGIPQGDPPSALLFNIFMDRYLHRINHICPSRGIATAFVDDVALLSKRIPTLQILLNQSVIWASENEMEWSILKSTLLSLTENVLMYNQIVPTSQQDVYLGVSISRHGVTDTSLISRLKRAQSSLARLRRITHSLKTTVRQRRIFVLTFVFSIVDYVLYLQPLTPEVLTISRSLELSTASFILGCSVPQAQSDRGLAIARITPIRWRRHRHMVRAVFKFFKAAHTRTAGYREKANWKTLKQYYTIRPLLTRSPLTLENQSQWYCNNLKTESAMMWPRANRHLRKIPMSNPSRLPPVYTEGLPSHLEPKASLWYLSRLPMRLQSLRNLNPTLALLLQKSNLTTDESKQLEYSLYPFL